MLQYSAFLKEKKMITECPNCKKTISVQKCGVSVCPKCGSTVFIGDPLKNEQNSVVEVRQVEIQQPEDFGNAGKIRQTLRKIDKMLDMVGGTPWDRVSEIGFADAFVLTTKELFLAPEHFFAKMVACLKPAFLPFYGVIAACISSLFQTFWALKFFHNFFPDFASFKTAVASLGAAALPLMSDEAALKAVFDMMNPTPAMLFLPLVVTPFMNIVVTSFILHTGSILLGANTRLIHFYRMSCFVMVTGLFNIIPVLGNLISFIWRVSLVYHGGKVSVLEKLNFLHFFMFSCKCFLWGWG